jgi:hypothetical protein
MVNPSRVAAVALLLLVLNAVGGCRKADVSNPPAPKGNTPATGVADTPVKPHSQGAGHSSPGYSRKKTSSDSTKQIGAVGASETVFLEPSKPATSATADNNPTPSPVGPPAALARAAELFTMDATDADEFRQSLVAARTVIPEVPAAVGDQPVKWNKIKLDQAGLGFDAIRFTSPLDNNSDLIWAIVMSEELGLSRWYITPAQGHINGFRGFEQVDDLNLDEIGFSRQTALILQELTWGEIRPKSEYFIWMAFQDQRPREAYVKLALVPSEPKALSDGSSKRSTWDRLRALRISDAPTPAGNDIVPYAIQLAESGGVDEAIRKLEERIKTDGANTSRAVRFTRLHFLFNRARDWSLRPETRDNAFRSFIETTALMREYKHDVGSLSFAERRTYGSLLFFEACALFNAGQKAKAIDSVREAIENGIDPRDFPDDPIGNALRQLPEYQALLETLDRKR